MLSQSVTYDKKGIFLQCILPEPGIFLVEIVCLSLVSGIL